MKVVSLHKDPRKIRDMGHPGSRQGGFLESGHHTACLAPRSFSTPCVSALMAAGLSNVGRRHNAFAFFQMVEVVGAHIRQGLDLS
jgi:hypothetical protein